ncbi:hypothetical protein MSG28_005424 [Choristoneura fumiferana]|uniref:Uncharacterized protein n=1 Tax=Choristoneura fumiferana TaxID=7141 RepID=A0ACC0JRV9_CHOFU|nr:hypothetical protein MSG28_005424 [Choristoneura fumiferana]
MRRFDVVLDCAGLGGAGAGAARLSASFGVYVTLTSPLLRRADALGLAPGAAAAAADLLRENLSAAAPAAPACLPRVRWAFFAPRADDIELLRQLAEQGKFGVSVERAWGWREGAAAYERRRPGPRAREAAARLQPALAAQGT